MLIPPSEYGVQCPSLNEVQPCQNPQCYVWDFDQWGSCMLDDPSEKCGTGQRNRQVYCTTHDKVIIAICNVNYLYSWVDIPRVTNYPFKEQNLYSLRLKIDYAYLNYLWCTLNYNRPKESLRSTISSIERFIEWSSNSANNDLPKRI